MKLTLKNNTRKRKQIASRLKKSIRNLEKYIKKTLKGGKYKKRTNKRNKTYKKRTNKRGGKCGCGKKYN
jgi:hypothetical protein